MGFELHDPSSRVEGATSQLNGQAGVPKGEIGGRTVKQVGASFDPKSAAKSPLSLNRPGSPPKPLHSHSFDSRPPVDGRRFGGVFDVGVGLVGLKRSVTLWGPGRWEEIAL